MLDILLDIDHEIITDSCASELDAVAEMENSCIQK
jgi:hypothetical protein